VLCESAFLDRRDRLTVIGIATQFPVPSLPVAINKIMLVARVMGVAPGEEMQVGVAISTPRGRWARPDASAFDVDQAGEYLLVTLRDVPLTEAGTYRFALALGSEETIVEAPVTLMAAPAQISIH
jgi:hypothetical protein